MSVPAVWGELRERVRSGLSPAEQVVLVWQLVALVVLVPTATRVSGGVVLVAEAILIVLGLGWLASRAGSFSPRLLGALRLLVLVFAAYVGYEEARAGVDLFRRYDLEPWFVRADLLLFGGHASRALGAIATPLLTDVLQVAYVAYYFVPVALVVWLLKLGRFEAVEEVLLGAALALHVAFLFYVLVPLQSPFLVAADPATAHLLQYDTELRGFALTEPIRRSLLEATTMRHDCFPSGHTALTLSMLVLAWRHHRAAFWTLLPVGAAIVLATVYLRYHYLVDLVAGAALAVLVVRIVPGWVGARLGVSGGAGSAASESRGGEPGYATRNTIR